MSEWGCFLLYTRNVVQILLLCMHEMLTLRLFSDPKNKPLDIYLSLSVLHIKYVHKDVYK